MAAMGKKRVVVALAALCLASGCGLAGCGGAAGPSSPVNQASSGNAAGAPMSVSVENAPALPEEVQKYATAWVAVEASACPDAVVEVGGYAVSAGVIDEALSQERSVRGLENDEAYQGYLAELGESAQQHYDALAQKAAERTRIQLAAREQGVTVSPEELSAAVEQQKQAMLGPSYSQQDWETVLTSMGKTEKEFAFDVYTWLLSSKIT